MYEKILHAKSVELRPMFEPNTVYSCHIFRYSAVFSIDSSINFTLTLDNYLMSNLLATRQNNYKNDTNNYLQNVKSQSKIFKNLWKININ